MESDLRFLLDQGKAFFKQQAYKKAETVFLKIISSKKEFADIYNMLGVITHQSGEFSSAIKHFQKALQINPRYTEAMMNLGVLYNDLGEYRLSKKLLSSSKKEAQKGPDKIDPFIKGKLANQHANVGDMYRGVGLFGDAIQEYQKALSLAPEYQDIRNRLAICLRESGKGKDAVKEFQRIVREKPEYVEAGVQLGITLFSLGQKNEAKKIWIKLAQQYPKHGLVKMYLRLSEGKSGVVSKK